MQYIIESTKNNELTKKVLPLLLLLFLLELVNVKYEIYTPDRVKLLSPFFLFLLILVVLIYLRYLLKGYLRETLFILYGYSSLILFSTMFLLLVLAPVIIWQGAEDSAYLGSTLGPVILLTLITVQTLEGLRFVELQHDLLFIKEDRKVIKFNYDAINNVSTDQQLIIESEEQKVAIDKGVIIERSVGSLELKINDRIPPTQSTKTAYEETT